MRTIINRDMDFDYGSINFSGNEVMRIGPQDANDPLSDARVYLRYTPNTLMVDVVGVGIRLVHVPDLHEVAPQLEGQFVRARRTRSGGPNIEEVSKE